MDSRQHRYKDLLQPCKLVFMTLASYPLVIAVFGVFLIYRNLIDIILRIKHGEKYGGLYDKQSSVWFTKGGLKPTITSVVIVKTEKEKDFFNEFKEKVRNKLLSNPDDYLKLTGSLAVFSGYPYVIKNGCDINKCINRLPVPEDVEFDENYLKELTGSIISKPLPQNHTATWEWLLSSKPLKRDKNDRYYHYVIITRFNHAVGDGAALLALTIRLFGDDNSELYNQKLFDKLSKKNPEKKSSLKTLKEYVKKITEFLKMIIYIFFMGLGKFIDTYLLTPEDQNALHGPEPTKNKFVAWTAENNIKYVPMVKRIKNRIDSKFSSIILTAVTASLTNYFKRNSYPIPESTKSLLPTTLSFTKLDGSKAVPLTNAFSSAVLEMPSHNYSASIIDTVKKVTENANAINYWDILFNKVIASQIGIFPIQLIQATPMFHSETTLMTNNPGGTQVKILDGCIMDKIIALAPNFVKIGVTISILTYDDKFQIGIMADKAVMKSQKEVQLLVDDIYQYIELLEKESMNIEEKLY